MDGLKDAHRDAIVSVLRSNERVEKAVLFGSRAKETFTRGSDVDIVLFGELLTVVDRARMAAAMEELTFRSGSTCFCTTRSRTRPCASMSDKTESNCTNGKGRHRIPVFPCRKIPRGKSNFDRRAEKLTAGLTLPDFYLSSTMSVDHP